MEEAALKAPNSLADVVEEAALKAPKSLADVVEEAALKAPKSFAGGGLDGLVGGTAP